MRQTKLVAIFLVCVSVLLLPHTAGTAAEKTSGQTLWQLGAVNDSATEFSDFPQLAAQTPESITVPDDWSTRTDWSLVPKGLKGDRNPAVEIHYTLKSVPINGVLLSVKLLDAPRSGPQAAVFSNGLCAGILQFWGTAEGNSSYKWRKTYKLYIPKEMLTVGPNVLRFETVRPMYAEASADPRVWWNWDFVRLDSLAEPVREPIHGAVAYLGTTLKQSFNYMFRVDYKTLQIAPPVLSWMGIAYSGNTIRADFWPDISWQTQPKRLQYLQLLRDMNMTVLADNMSGSNFVVDAKGNLPDAVKAKVQSYFATYGSLFQYYELGNEPCMFGGPGGYAEYVALAKYIDQIKPVGVKVTAPGWAFGGGQGNPLNWDADPLRRRQVEQYCQATNGHSYGYSYSENKGGSFMEDLAEYGNVEDGWPKEYLTSETGTNDWHSEENGAHFASSQTNAEAFDRIMRAHLAVVDRTMQHASSFNDFGIFQGVWSTTPVSAISAYPGVKGQDPRLKTYRRLALAYATHGAPLPYVYVNPSAVTGKKVYFRAVDTSAIPGQASSQAVSNKILLNFVNFESTPQTMAVRVTLLATGDYQAERYGPGNTYADAHSTSTLSASPAVDLTVDLGPGDSVQYILTPPGVTKPYAPENVDAEAVSGGVSVSWSACANATGYNVLRRTAPAGAFKQIAQVATPAFADNSVSAGKVYDYGIIAVDPAGSSDQSTAAEVTAGVPVAPLLVVATPADGEASLSWDAVPGATAYKLSRSESLSGPFATVGTTHDASFSERGLTDGTLYYYHVYGTNASGDGPWAPAQVAPESGPSVPTQLVASPGDNKVDIKWAASPGAFGYVVKRSSTPGGPFEVLPALVQTAEFIDTNVADGATYSYSIAAKGLAVEGAFSAPVSATPVAETALAPWHQSDIGNVGAPGTASVSGAGATVKIAGSGDNLWGVADGAHFIYQTLTGDGSLTAHVDSFDNTDPFATVGVMVRESLDAGSKMTTMGITPGHGCAFPHRDQTGAECGFAGGPAWNWVKIERKGDLLTGSISQDGQTWKQIGTATQTMKPAVLIGLVACSHVHGLCNAQFSGITLIK